MLRAFYKDTFREIKKSFGRFMGITLIICLGCAFFVGIKTTCPDMKISANNYFEESNLFDYRFLSTVGFDEEDILIFKENLPLSQIFPGHFIDCLIENKSSIEDNAANQREDVIRLHSLSEASTINKPYVIEGRLPTAIGEIALENNQMFSSMYNIGDELTLNSGKEEKISENLKSTKYTVVGIISSPMYIAKDRGTTSIGNGQVRSFGYINEKDFKADYYTEIYATIDDKETKAYEKAYDNLIEEYDNIIGSFLKKQQVIKEASVIKTANDTLNENIAKFNDEKQEAQKELDKANKDLLKAQQELKDGTIKLANQEKKAYADITNGQKKIDDGLKEYNTGYKKYQTGKKDYDKYYNKYIIGKEQYDSGLKLYNKNLLEFNTKKNKAIKNGTYEFAIDEFTKNEAILVSTKKQLDANKIVLTNTKATLKETKLELTLALKELTQSKALLDTKQKELDSNKLKADQEFAKQKQILKNGKIELEEGKIEYANAKKEAENEFKKAEDSINEAKEDIANIPNVTFHSLNRNMNKGYVEYGMAADRMAAIGNVFPLLFVLVAVLICLTGMGRMVEEQRLYIGTCKALGYKKSKIISKFIIYASASSLLGATIGCIIGFPLFPSVINNAYSVLYNVPNFVITIDYTLILITFAASVLVTCLSAIFVCYSELHSQAAQLLRPKAPKAGKTIILERFPFIWKRLKFTQKITMRNIIRYKSRFFMTVIGVAGCTALLLIGFGLRDVVTSIVSKQYGEINTYSLAVSLKPDLTDKNIKDIIDIAKQNPQFYNALLYSNKSVDVQKDKITKNATLTVIDNLEEFDTHINLKERKGQKPLEMTTKEVIITEKLSTMLDLKVNDSISFTNSDLVTKSAKIIGITENYVMHHIYISKELYKELYNEDPSYNDLYIKLNTNDVTAQEELSKELSKNKYVSSVSMTADLSINFEQTIGSINSIIVILVISAALLSFIVLFTLTSINISERLREIATIKVLGMMNKEVSSYVFKEGLLVTLIGIIIGLFIGGPAALYVILSAEIDMVMFGRDLYPLSYFFAGAMTLAFAIIVNLIMRIKLKKINMVEALKTVE